MGKLLPVKIYPAPILRESCQKVKEVDREIKEFAESLAKTMEEKDGAGLAAPQLGSNKRIIAVMSSKGPAVFLNPEITEKSKEKDVLEEGCLSFPGLWLNIKRPKKVKVEALNIEGQKVQVEAEGILAKVFQHEIDHLNGILFIDRLGFVQKLKIRKQLKQWEKQK